MRFNQKRQYPFHFETHDPELDRLLKPTSSFRSPSDVLNDPDLTLSEKKAILASWASDACAVADRPAFRQPAELCHAVSFDDIMTALQALDRRPSAPAPRFAHRGKDPNQSPIC